MTRRFDIKTERSFIYYKKKSIARIFAIALIANKALCSIFMNRSLNKTFSRRKTGSTIFSLPSKLRDFPLDNIIIIIA